MRLKLDTITGTGRAITSTPLREQIEPKIFPAIVFGTMSPYLRGVTSRWLHDFSEVSYYVFNKMRLWQVNLLVQLKVRHSTTRTHTHTYSTYNHLHFSLFSSFVDFCVLHVAIPIIVKLDPLTLTQASHPKRAHTKTPHWAKSTDSFSESRYY